jgi:hypothetical protein
MPQENVGLASFATKVTYWFSQFSATFFKYFNFWYFNLFWNRCSTKFNKRLTLSWHCVKVQSTIYLISIKKKNSLKNII